MDASKFEDFDDGDPLFAAELASPGILEAVSLAIDGNVPGDPKDGDGHSAAREGEPPEREPSDRVAPFLLKLYEIVNMPDLDHHICWKESGDAFRIVDPSAFASEVLPLYFKHNNLRSFIRQCNMYGFYRAPSKGGKAIEFYHEKFMRAGRAKLKEIKRGQVTRKPPDVTHDEGAAGRGGEGPGSELEQLSTEMAGMHNYILKLEEDLMSHIVQLHDKLCKILQRLDTPPQAEAGGMGPGAGMVAPVGGVQGVANVATPAFPMGRVLPFGLPPLQPKI